MKTIKMILRDISLLWEEFAISEWGFLAVAIGLTVFTIGFAVGTSFMVK